MRLDWRLEFDEKQNCLVRRWILPRFGVRHGPRMRIQSVRSALHRRAAGTNDRQHQFQLEQQ